MQDAQYLHADGNDAIKQEVAGRFDPAAGGNTVAAAGEMVDVKLFG